MTPSNTKFIASALAKAVLAAGIVTSLSGCALLMTKKERLAMHGGACAGYGLKTGTNKYSDCVHGEERQYQQRLDKGVAGIGSMIGNYYGDRRREKRERAARSFTSLSSSFYQPRFSGKICAYTEILNGKWTSECH